MAKLRYQGKEYDFVTGGTFQESADIEIESGIPLEKMTTSHKGALRVLITLRRNGYVMSWADVMTMDGDEIDIVDEPDPTPAAAPARRAPQDRKPRKAPARRGGAAAASPAE